MTKRIYLMKYKHQDVVPEIPELLVSLGASVFDPCKVREVGMQTAVEESQLIVITLHDGDDFGSKHTCVSRSLEQAEKRGFHISKSFSEVIDLHSVPVLTLRNASVGSEGLRAEVMAFQTADNCLSLMRPLAREAQTEYALR